MQRSVHIEPCPVHDVRRFATWIASSTDPGDRVLNVGAGASRSGAMRPLLDRGPYLVGIDPDEAVRDNPTLDEAQVLTMREYAASGPEPFDIACCVYVLEHIADPGDFMACVAAVLKPGGSFFGLTLNMYQYFGLLTWAATRAGVAESLLHRLKPDAHHDGQHFPTQYRVNSIGRVCRHLESSGFASVEFRCFEATERYAWYLPRPLRPMATAYTKVAYAARRPEMMGHLSFRAILGERR